MRVAVLMSDTGACGAYRMLWPAESVKQIRPEWDVQVYSPRSVAFYTDRATGQLAQVAGLPDVSELDLVVLHRVGKPILLQMMRKVQASGCAVVLDNDDAMWAIDKRNAAWAAWNNTQTHWRVTDEAARIADLCTSTTPALSKRYGDGRSEVLPNVVPEFALDGPAAYELERDRPTIGWSGQLSTHPGDPLVVGDAVKQAVDDTGCLVVGQPDAAGLQKLWGVPVEPLAPAQLGPDYYTSLRAFDVALVPLRDTPFNRAKSALKALECSAAGCAVVASPTPANRELARTLPILLASSPAEWREHVTRLVRTPEERRERGSEARFLIQQAHTFETQATRWANAWSRAVARRARLVAV